MRDENLPVFDNYLWALNTVVQSVLMQESNCETETNLGSGITDHEFCNKEKLANTGAIRRKYKTKLSPHPLYKSAPNLSSDRQLSPQPGPSSLSDLNLTKTPILQHFDNIFDPLVHQPSDDPTVSEIHSIWDNVMGSDDKVVEPIKPVPHIPKGFQSLWKQCYIEGGLDKSLVKGQSSHLSMDFSSKIDDKTEEPLFKRTFQKLPHFNPIYENEEDAKAMPSGSSGRTNPLHRQTPDTSMDLCYGKAGFPDLDLETAFKTSELDYNYNMGYTSNSSSSGSGSDDGSGSYITLRELDSPIRVIDEFVLNETSGNFYTDGDLADQSLQEIQFEHINDAK